MKQNIFDTLINRFQGQSYRVYDVVELFENSIRKKSITPHSSCKNCYSISKNFTAAAVGMLIDDGLMTLGTRASDFFTKKQLFHAPNRFYDVTLRHLLTHTAGDERGYLFESDRYSAPADWVRFCLSHELPYAAGEKMTYSNSNYYLLSVICEKAAGMTLMSFLYKRLFSPLEFEGAVWESCSQGHTMGATGLYLRTEDMAKLGLLFACGGVYGGKRYLSEEFTVEATRPQYFQNYGLSFWLTKQEGVYYGDGAHSQKLYIDTHRKCATAVHAFDDIPYDRLVAFEE